MVYQSNHFRTSALPDRRNRRMVHHFRTRFMSLNPGRRLRRLAALLVAILLFGGSAFGQSGKITGKVTAASTGEELIGVNVILEGTTIGATTNLSGEYVIIGVRPGTYTLVVSYVGFQTVRNPGVRVSIDLTTRENFELAEEAFEGEEIVVVAERPLVQRDLTATTAVVSGDEIRSIPVENFDDVVNLQAGVVDGHFRGGRIGEVGYWIDGVPVTDVFDGSLGVELENSSVQEVQVVTGAFNAEYGQAMSGIVNVVTRDGDNNFSGGFTSFTGDYLVTDTEAFENLDVVSPAAVRNVEMDFSGPIFKDKLFFFTSGRYFKNNGWMYGRRVFEPDDIGFSSAGRLELLNRNGSGDSTLVSMNPYEKFSGQAKLTWRISSRIRLSVNTVLSREDFRDYDHSLRFLPDAQANRDRTGRTVFAKWTHTLSNTTFYEIAFSDNYSTYTQRLYEDPFDPRYLDNTYWDLRDEAWASQFRVGGTDNQRVDRSTETRLAKFDLTSQIDRYNLVKVGVEVRQHNLNYTDELIVVLPNIETFVFPNGTYNYKPVEFSAYAQDKLEIGSLIINAGLRLDYFNSDGVVFEDPRDPETAFEFRQEPPEAGEGFEKAEAKVQLSPRLGVAFPITETGVVHFAYGWFFQIPNFELLYQNPYFRLGGGSGLIGLIGNANLNPEKTINGEIGLKQQLTPSTALELTAYFRDIRDLAGSATDPIVIEGTSARYGRLVNSDFGFIRGVVLRLDQRVGSGFFLNADYTYQVAKTNASDPDQAYNAAAAKGQLEQQILPTNWDQRHTANLSMSYAAPQDWGFGMVATYGSGQPYTPRQTTLQTGTILPTKIPLNSEVKPGTFTIDLRVFKDFVFGASRFQVFAKVDNLLDRRNEFNVFEDTGRATYSLERNVDASNHVGPVDFLDRYYTRPEFFSEPRRVVMGLSYRF